MTLPLDMYPRVLQALDHISQGKTQTYACDLAGVRVDVFKRYVAETPELSELFVDCEQRGYDRMADALLNIDMDVNYGTTDPKKMKIVSDNIKWFLSRKRPQQYGERITVENTFTADKAITDALERGKQRALQGRVLEGVTYTVVEEVAETVAEDLSQFI